MRIKDLIKGDVILVRYIFDEELYVYSGIINEEIGDIDNIYYKYISLNDYSVNNIHGEIQASRIGNIDDELAELLNLNQ